MERLQGQARDCGLYDFGFLNVSSQRLRKYGNRQKNFDVLDVSGRQMPKESGNFQPAGGFGLRRRSRPSLLAFSSSLNEGLRGHLEPSFGLESDMSFPFFFKEKPKTDENECTIWIIRISLNKYSVNFKIKIPPLFLPLN